MMNNLNMKIRYYYMEDDYVVIVAHLNQILRIHFDIFKVMSKKRGEIRELQDKLSDPDIEQKQEAIRRIIDAMTRGKDVSMLFMDVMKNMET